MFNYYLRRRYLDSAPMDAPLLPPPSLSVRDQLLWMFCFGDYITASKPPVHWEHTLLISTDTGHASEAYEILKAVRVHMIKLASWRLPDIGMHPQTACRELTIRKPSSIKYPTWMILEDRELLLGVSPSRFSVRLTFYIGDTISDATRARLGAPIESCMPVRRSIGALISQYAERGGYIVARTSMAGTSATRSRAANTIRQMLRAHADQDGIPVGFTTMENGVMVLNFGAAPKLPPDSHKDNPHLARNDEAYEAPHIDIVRLIAS